MTIPEPLSQRSVCPVLGSMGRNGVTLAAVSLVSKMRSQQRSQPGHEKQDECCLCRDCASAISLPPELTQHGKGTLPFVFLPASISADVSHSSLEDVICSFPAPWAVVFHRLLEGFRLSFAAAEGCETALVVPPAFFGSRAAIPCVGLSVPSAGCWGSAAGTVSVAADGTGAMLAV